MNYLADQSSQEDNKVRNSCNILLGELPLEIVQAPFDLFTSMILNSPYIFQTKYNFMLMMSTLRMTAIIYKKILTLSLSGHISGT